MRSDTIGLGLFFAGVLALLSVRVINDRDDWILAEFALPVTATASHTQEVTARRDGYAEIQIEVDAAIAPELRGTYILPTNSPSALDIGWEVANDGRVIAAGDARDYLYVEGMHSLLGRFRRIIMQVPFGRNEAHWNRFGLAGSRTIVRGIGRVSLAAGDRYAVRVTALGDNSDLRDWSPMLVVRVDRRVWQNHYERVRILGYLGLLLVAVGGPITVFGRLRRARLPLNP